MSDAYLKFSNTKLGARLTAWLGLPQPRHLNRYQSNQAWFSGDVLLGAAINQPDDTLLTTASNMLQAMGASCFAYHSMQRVDGLVPWQAGNALDALVFDASQFMNVDDAHQLYDFFHATVKSLRPNGRVLVLALPPEECTDPNQALVQRALEGFTRSLAKELRHAVTVQLIYVANGAEQNIESTLRFFLSARSAYVSGQVVRVTLGNSEACVSNWQAPLKVKKEEAPKILVTGASQGIGLAIVEVLSRDGAHVVCLDRPQTDAALDHIVGRLNCEKILLDLSLDDAPQRLAEYAQRDGGWDAVIHNAGITKDKTIANMTERAWSQVVTVNLRVQERVNSALIESGGLKSGGRIVCVSSISGIAGNRGQTNYAFSKAGVIGLVQAYAPIFQQQGITINAVAPGFIETEMTAAMPFSIREAGRRLNSLSQGGLPVDVAETISWLVSPASSGLTGNVIRVCGQSMLDA